MDEQQESWQNKIRSLAPKLSTAEEELFKSEADVKRLQAKLELIAAAKGAKTISAQKTYADNTDELYLARLTVGVCKGQVSAIKIELKSLDVGFEEWRTKMANAREERKRYGA